MADCDGATATGPVDVIDLTVPPPWGHRLDAHRAPLPAPRPPRGLPNPPDAPYGTASDTGAHRHLAARRYLVNRVWACTRRDTDAQRRDRVASPTPRTMCSSTLLAHAQSMLSTVRRVIRRRASAAAGAVVEGIDTGNASTLRMSSERVGVVGLCDLLSARRLSEGWSC